MKTLFKYSIFGCASGLLTLATAQAQSDVVAEQSGEENAAAETLALPRAEAPWAGALGAKYGLTTGTKRVSSLSLYGNTQKQWTWGRFEADGSLMRVEDSSLPQPENYLVTAAEKLSYFLGSKAYLFEAVDYKRDTINALSYRVFALAGPGLSLWAKDADNAIDFELGAGARFQELAGEKDDGTGVYQAQMAGRFLVSSVKLQQNVRYVSTFDNADDYLFESKTKVSVPVSTSVASTNELVYTNVGLPAEGAPEDTVALTLGVEYAFGKN